MKWLVVRLVALSCLLGVFTVSAYAEERSELLQAMVLTGQSNHGWRFSSAHYKQSLEATGLFEVDLLTSPPSGADAGVSDWRPVLEHPV